MGKVSEHSFNEWLKHNLFCEERINWSSNPIQGRGTERSTVHTYTSTAEIECKYNWGEKALTSVNKSREDKLYET